MASAAKVYIDEMRKGFDDTVLPVFTPDTTLEVGSICSFDDGRLVSRGHVRDRGGEIPTASGAPTPSWTFATKGAVEFTPAVRVALSDGSPAFSAEVSFGSSRAVVASFGDVVETTAVDADDVDRIIWEMFLAGRLREDRIVVWSVRRATRGTVLVSSGRGATASLTAPVAEALTLGGLSAGVKFSHLHEVGYSVSEAPLTAFVRAKRITPQGEHLAEDVRRFDVDRQREMRRQAVQPFTTDVLLAGAD